MKKFSVVLVVSVMAAVLILPTAADAAWWNPFAVVSKFWRPTKILKEANPSSPRRTPLYSPPSPSTSGNPSTNPPTECMVEAVDARDDAIILAWGVYSDAIKTALGFRESNLKDAWAITDKTQRKAALEKAWTAWRLDSKTARNIFDDAKKAAWKQFEKDRKNCNAPNDDMNGLGADAGI